MMARLNVQPPAGAHFEFRHVKTAKGTKDLGEVPILIWDDWRAAGAYFGDSSMLDALNGTSPLIAYQGIARRMRLAGKTDDEIAEAEVRYRPGSREVGASTPKSRARSAAVKAAEALGGDGGDVIAALLERVARGDISKEDLAAIAGLK